jgi:hypothetical protein
MSVHIVSNSVELCKFIARLGLRLTHPQLRHVTNVADALVVSEARRKTLSALHRELLDPPSDQYALADCFREGAWTVEHIRSRLLVYLVRLAIRLACLLHLEKIIFISCDDSLCVKDAATRYLEAVDWHHDHTASTKKRPVYRNGSVYVLCRLQIGFIQFTINWRLYLRRKTVRRLNRRRAKPQRLSYASKYTLAQQMLEELRPLLPHDFTVYVLFDSWYTAAKLITFIRRQGWHVICALKANRTLRRPGQPGQPRVVKQQVRQWAKELRYTPYTRVRVEAADATVTTYLVRSLTGRLNRAPFDVCVLISKRTRRDKRPAYFLCTDLSLNPQTVLKYYLLRWPCEVDNWYLKEALGLADYQMQKLEAIAKYHAVVFLALAYLQWRAVHITLRDRTAPSTLADVIHEHRQEHYRQLVEAVARMTLDVGAVEPVLDHFLRQSPPQPLPVTPPVCVRTRTGRLVQPVSVVQTAPGHT